MRILWVSNAPWAASGYGEQAALFLPRLEALGHQMAVSANFGLQGAPQEWNGITVFPADAMWGNSTLATYAKTHDADLVIILHDAWVLQPQAWGDNLPPVAVWAPIDHYPIPPLVLGVLQHEQIRPVAMSRFGEQQMTTMGLDPLYVPHGYDGSVFYPNPDIKAAVRAELGIDPDTFLVGMVAANSGSREVSRKGFPQAFDAFARLARNHDDARLYVHTRAEPPGGAINLVKLAMVLGIEDKVKFPPDQIWHLRMERQTLANLYQAFDVLLNPSMGEGFGVPILEAQACGVPVICSDHSAMSELTQAGWLVNGDPWWDSMQESFFVVPAIDSITLALEAAYERRDDEDLRKAAAGFAKQYDADFVTETFWKPTLDALTVPREAAPFAGATLPVMDGESKLNRAQRRALAKQKVSA